MGASANPIGLIASLRETLHQLHPNKAMPVDRVLWVPHEKVKPNDYNPNSVAKVEMQLLHTSISHDGYTQPTVTIYDPALDRYVIVDGFHRYFVMKTFPDIYKRCNGLLPVVVIDKGMNDRMASTVRHNRARGKHSVDGMSNLVFQMLDGGWSDEEVCNELGMTAEEIVRLKHVTGFSKLFDNVEYRKAWMSHRQVKMKAELAAGNPPEKPN
jgi:ParB-like chromosome segregation protein Spo0J